MNDAQLLQFSRHIMLSDFDIAGQESLLRAKVLLIGAGGLGSPSPSTWGPPAWAN